MCNDEQDQVDSFYFLIEIKGIESNGYIAVLAYSKTLFLNIKHYILYTSSMYYQNFLNWQILIFTLQNHFLCALKQT